VLVITFHLWKSRQNAWQAQEPQQAEQSNKKKLHQLSFPQASARATIDLSNYSDDEDVTMG
jgi:hypothetical protein